MWILLPIKNFAYVKQRLGGLLTAVERGALVRAMATDVLSTLTGYSDTGRIVVCSSDAQARELAHEWSVQFLFEADVSQRGGVNEVVNAAAQLLEMQGARDVFCIPGDVPALSNEELAAFREGHNRLDKPSVSMTPDRHGTGTNLIAWQPESGFSVAFGPGSSERHRKSALRIGAAIYTYRSLGSGLDIDEPDDLRALLLESPEERAQNTKRYLYQSGLAQRVLASHNTDGGLAKERSA